MINKENKDSAITAQINSCAMPVHAELGYCYQEVNCQSALKDEMNADGISFDRGSEVPIHYKEPYIGTRRCDYLIEDITILVQNLFNLNGSQQIIQPNNQEIP